MSRCWDEGIPEFILQTPTPTIALMCTQMIFLGKVVKLRSQKSTPSQMANGVRNSSSYVARKIGQKCTYDHQIPLCHLGPFWAWAFPRVPRLRLAPQGGQSLEERRWTNLRLGDSHPPTPSGGLPAPLWDQVAVG